MPFVDVADLKLHYRFDGREDAPVVLLSNSLGTEMGMWEPQMPALSSRYRVLRYDTRGHGSSSITPGPYTIEGLARDALSLLDALGIHRVHFCGLSMGGMVGQWLGVHAPQRIAKLALCNTAPRIGPPEAWNARIDGVRNGGMAAIVEAVLGRWFTQAFHTGSPAAVQEMRAMLLRSSPDGYVAACAAIRDMDQRESVSAIALNTLVIAGTYDVATPPADGRFLADRIAGARYVELPAAHISNIEAAPAFTRALTEFLAD